MRTRRAGISPRKMATYSIVRPIDRVRVPCQQVDCEAWAFGWVTAIDPNLDMGGFTGEDRADYIRASGRTFTEHTRRDGVLEFVFAAGQTCFAEHTANSPRDPSFLRRVGVPGAFLDAYAHTNVDHWVEDFAGNQDRLSKYAD